MLDDCGRFPLVEEVRQFPKHFLREVPNLLVRPFPCFRQREDRGKLSRGQASGAGPVPFRTIGMVRTVSIAVPVSIGMPIPVCGRRLAKVKMQSDSEQRGALFEAVRRCGLQIISKRNDRIVLLGSRDPGFPKLTLRDSLRRQLAENDNFFVVNPVILDVEDPLRIEAFVEPLNYGATFYVIEHVSIRALSSLDLCRHERFFEDFSIHKFSFQFFVKNLDNVPASSNWRGYQLLGGRTTRLVSKTSVIPGPSERGSECGMLRNIIMKTMPFYMLIESAAAAHGEKHFAGNITNIDTFVKAENLRKLEDQHNGTFAFLAFHPLADAAVAAYAHGDTIASDAGAKVLVLFTEQTDTVTDSIEGGTSSGVAGLRLETGQHPAYIIVRWLFSEKSAPPLPGILLFSRFSGEVSAVFVPLAGLDEAAVRQRLRKVFSVAATASGAAPDEFADKLGIGLAGCDIDYVKNERLSLGEWLASAWRVVREKKYEIVAAIASFIPKPWPSTKKPA